MSIVALSVAPATFYKRHHFMKLCKSLKGRVKFIDITHITLYIDKVSIQILVPFFFITIKCKVMKKYTNQWKILGVKQKKKSHEFANCIFVNNWLVLN